MIRPATPEDIPALVEMGRKFHSLSPWRDVPFSAEAVTANLTAVLASPTAAVFIAEGKGAIGVYLAPIYFAADTTICQELFWWCEGPREALALVAAADEWRKERGALRLLLMRLAGVRDEGMDRLYRRMGFRLIEHTYCKDD